MNLYICIDGSFAGTQADAKAKGKGWTAVEVPTDKAGLIAYLNGMVDEQRADGPRDSLGGSQAERPIDEAVLQPRTTAAPDPAFEATKARSRTSQEIVEFVLDEATVAQVENIFRALGARFGEARS